MHLIGTLWMLLAEAVETAYGHSLFAPPWISEDLQQAGEHLIQHQQNKQ